jgi:hypothetical protein
MRTLEYHLPYLPWPPWWHDTNRNDPILVMLPKVAKASSIGTVTCCCYWHYQFQTSPMETWLKCSSYFQNLKVRHLWQLQIFIFLQSYLIWAVPLKRCILTIIKMPMFVKLYVSYSWCKQKMTSIKGQPSQANMKSPWENLTASACNVTKKVHKVE